MIPLTERFTSPPPLRRALQGRRSTYLNNHCKTTEATFAALGRSWDALGTFLARSWTLLGRSWTLLDALGCSWDPLGTLLARFRDLQGSILASPELLQEAPDQPKRTNASIPKVDRKLSKNCPRRFRKPSPPALYSQLLYLFAKKLEAGGLRAAN